MHSHTFTLPDGKSHTVTPRTATDDEAIDQALLTRSAYLEATVDQLREIYEETASTLDYEAAREMGLLAEAIAAGGYKASAICRVIGQDLDAGPVESDVATLELPMHAVRYIAALVAADRERLAREEGPSLANSAAWDSVNAIESALPEGSGT